MNNLLTTLAALAAVGTGTALAIFDSVPLVTDALTGAGLGGFVAGLVVAMVMVSLVDRDGFYGTSPH